VNEAYAVPEEPCQCPDCQRFYREHDRLIRENPSLRQQQELSWAALQAFRTLAGRVLEDLQKTQESANSAGTQPLAAAGTTAAPAAPEADDVLQQALADLENVNAHLFSIEVLMERIFDVRVPEVVEHKFQELAGELAPDPLNADRLRLNRLLHQTPDLP
jgi:predicted RNase H-like nuclease